MLKTFPKIPGADIRHKRNRKLGIPEFEAIREYADFAVASFLAEKGDPFG
jgi:hypothetical protein